jgi:cell wall-associated NlpC family hydrolase
MLDLYQGAACDRVERTPRRVILAGLAGLAAAFTTRASGAQTVGEAAPVTVGPDYLSPYSLAFSIDTTLLNTGFDRAPWNDPDAEAAESVPAWETAYRGARGAAWGPPARQYPQPTLARQDEDYRRQRVISVAARHIGLPYQHHHVPSWGPPAGWPWLPVEAGSNGPGLDCSNFVSFAYNYALGLKLPTGIALQGHTVDLPGPGDVGVLRARRIDVRRYDDLRAVLAPADLLYIRNRQDRVSHVVMWLGVVGQSPTATPLILDCTQTLHRDASGATIPIGVRLRPFREDGWYWRRFSHAHRLIGAEVVMRPGTVDPLPEGDDQA